MITYKITNHHSFSKKEKTYMMHQMYMCFYVYRYTGCNEKTGYTQEH